MPTTVKGRYKNGVVELLETPPEAREGDVLVTFPDANGQADRPSVMLPRGKYKGNHLSTEEDFKSAEWHGESRFDDI